MSAGAMLSVAACWDANRHPSPQESLQEREKRQALVHAMEKVQPSMYRPAHSGRHRTVGLAHAWYVSNSCQQQFDIGSSQRLGGELTLFVSSTRQLLWHAQHYTSSHHMLHVQGPASIAVALSRALQRKVHMANQWPGSVAST